MSTFTYQQLGGDEDVDPRDAGGPQIYTEPMDEARMGTGAEQTMVQQVSLMSLIQQQEIAKTRQRNMLIGFGLAVVGGAWLLGSKKWR
jgi:hypothetical protein